MIVNVEAEINKHRNCKERGELERRIQEYKSLAMQYATNFTLAGQYNTIARKLQEICDKLPAPNLKPHTSSAPKVSVKTVALNNEDKAKINAAWEQRAGNKQGGVKR